VIYPSNLQLMLAIKIMEDNWCCRTSFPDNICHMVWKSN